MVVEINVIGCLARNVVKLGRLLKHFITKQSVGSNLKCEAFNLVIKTPQEVLTTNEEK